MLKFVCLFALLTVAAAGGHYRSVVNPGYSNVYNNGLYGNTLLSNGLVGSGLYSNGLIGSGLYGSNVLVNRGLYGVNSGLYGLNNGLYSNGLYGLNNGVYTSGLYGVNNGLYNSGLLGYNNGLLGYNNGLYGINNGITGLNNGVLGYTSSIPASKLTLNSGVVGNPATGGLANVNSYTTVTNHGLGSSLQSVSRISPVHSTVLSTPQYISSGIPLSVSSLPLIKK